MAILNELADFVEGIRYSELSRHTIENMKMHVLDTLTAMFAGPQTADGESIGRFIDSIDVRGEIPVTGFGISANLTGAIIAGSASARCTEVDDIHLLSCTTPGSVIIPTAISLAHAGYITDSQEFLLVVAIGYEVFIRTGLAVNGPEVLYRGVWPTLLGAAPGAAAATSRALRLNREQAASAFSAALAMSTGTTVRSRNTPSFRWLLLGLAAHNGATSALAAAQGFYGDDTFVEKSPPINGGVKMEPEKLISGLGNKWLIDETGMKPFPIARQGLSGVEAFREIIVEHQIQPGEIEDVIISVPPNFLTIINRPEFSPGRMYSITSIQNQVALSLIDPVKLNDLEREKPSNNPAVKIFAERVRVEGAADLEKYYPSIWPAKVELRAGGKSYSREMLYPRGDFRNPFTWEEISDKFRRATLSRLDNVSTQQILSAVQNMEVQENFSSLIGLLKRPNIMIRNLSRNEGEKD